ncbi:MAG: dTDP-4-dehydrorhamnose reductase [Chlamydiota bacterium]
MKYALIGKKGLLASAFAEALAQKKASFQTFSQEEIDITNPDSLKRLAPFAIWINCAAYTNVSLAEKEKTQAWSLNVEGPKNLAKAARQYQAKLIHFSTDYVFDGKKRAPYEEHDLASPLNVYGLTKYEGEKAALLLHEKTLVIRTSWLFSLEKPCFLTKIFAAADKKKPLFVVDDQKGRPTYVHDLVEATFLLEQDEGMIHFANRGACSWYAFAKEALLMKQNGNPTKGCAEIHPISSENQEVMRPAYSVLSTKAFETKYAHILDWKDVLRRARAKQPRADQ